MIDYMHTRNQTNQNQHQHQYLNQIYQPNGQPIPQQLHMYNQNQGLLQQNQINPAFGIHQPVMMQQQQMMSGQIQHANYLDGQEMYQQQLQYAGQQPGMNGLMGQNLGSHHLYQNQIQQFGGMQGQYLGHPSHSQQPYHPNIHPFHNQLPNQQLPYLKASPTDIQYPNQYQHYQQIGQYHQQIDPSTHNSSLPANNRHPYFGHIQPQQMSHFAQPTAQTMQQMSSHLNQQFQDSYLFDQPQQVREDSSEEGSMKRGGPGHFAQKRRGTAAGQLTKPNSTLGAGEIYHSGSLQTSVQSHLEERTKRKFRGAAGIDRQQIGPSDAEKNGEYDDDESEKLFAEAIEKRGSSAPAKFKFFKNRQEINSASALQMQAVKLSQNQRDIDHEIMSQGKSPGIQRLLGFNKITNQDDNANPDEEDNSPRTNQRIDSLYGELDQGFAKQLSSKLKIQHGGSAQLSDENKRRLSGDIGCQDNDIPPELRSHGQRTQQRSNSNIGTKLSTQAFNALSGIQEIPLKGQISSLGNLIDPQQNILQKYKPRRRLSTVESEKNMATMGLRLNAQGYYEQYNNSSAKRKEDAENYEDRSNNIKIEGDQPVNKQTPPKDQSLEKPESKVDVASKVDEVKPVADEPTGSQTQPGVAPVQNRARGESSFSTYFDDPYKYMQIVNSHLEGSNGSFSITQPQKGQPNQPGNDNAVPDTGLENIKNDIQQTKQDIQLAAYESKMNRLRIGPHGSYRKRINSGNLIPTGNIPGSSSLLLENIDETDEQNMAKDRRRGQGTAAGGQGSFNVEFLKNQFQQFTLGVNDNDQQKDEKIDDQPQEQQKQQQSRKGSENIEIEGVLAENSKSSRKLSSSQHSNNQVQTQKQASGFVVQQQTPPPKDHQPKPQPNPPLPDPPHQHPTPQPSLQDEVKQLKPPVFKKPTVNLKLTVAQIAKKYGLNAGYDTMEGQRRLLISSKRDERMELFQYSSILAKDQAGCRFLQQQITLAAKSENDSTEDKEILDQIFDYTIINAYDLMVDSFGNYLIQKLVEHCSQDQLTMIIQCLEHTTFEVCKDTHGTRSIQKIIETIQRPVQFELLRQYIMKSFVDLCYDINGNHVMQKILKTWSESDNQFIYDAMNDQCEVIARHKHGCCIMQKSIDQATPSQLDHLTQTIAAHTVCFIVDPFANYVVQYVLQLKIEKINQKISESILKEYAFFSQQKFSSNVIEKCLEFNSLKINQQIVRHIMIDNSAGVYPLLSHQFGNYVIQKCLHVCGDEMLPEVIESVKTAVRMLPKGGEFEKKIYQRIVKKYPALADPNVQTFDMGQDTQKPKQKGNQRQGNNNRQNQMNNSNKKKGPSKNFNNQYQHSHGQQMQQFGSDAFGIHHPHSFSSPEKQNLNINININYGSGQGYSQGSGILDDPNYGYNYNQGNQNHQGGRQGQGRGGYNSKRGHYGGQPRPYQGPGHGSSQKDQKTFNR